MVPSARGRPWKLRSVPGSFAPPPSLMAGNYGKNNAPWSQDGPNGAWAWWTEMGSWEPGTKGRAAVDWRRPKQTPTVRPPWGVQPRASSLRGFVNSRLGTESGGWTPSSFVSSSLRTPGTGSTALPPMATPRTYRELQDARVEIERRAHTKTCLVSAPRPPGRP